MVRVNIKWGLYIMFRIKCAAVHLLLSLIFAVTLYWLVFYIWYPQPLSVAVGVGSIFLMVLVVDMVLGPLLTFLVSKKDKASLIFDWSVIAVLQIAALAYGVF